MPLPYLILTFYRRSYNLKEKQKEMGQIHEGRLWIMCVVAAAAIVCFIDLSRRGLPLGLGPTMQGGVMSWLSLDLLRGRAKLTPFFP